MSTPTMILDFAAATHVGAVRTENQDALVVDGWVAQSPRLLHTGRTLVRAGSTWTAAVVDGMGGYAGGATAALLVATHLATSLRARRPGDPPETWARAYQQASEQVATLAAASPPLSQMGATAAGIVVSPTGVSVTNVGDARVYRWWKGYFTQLSEDDRTPSTNAITQSLGAHLRGAPDPHLLDIAISDPTRLLLCSDGLWDVAHPDVVKDLVSAERDLDRAVQALVDAAITDGGGDNISVIVVDLHPEDGDEPRDEERP